MDEQIVECSVKALTYGLNLVSGPNGSGKSTLLKQLAHFYLIHEQSYVYLGHEQGIPDDLSVKDYLVLSYGLLALKFRSELLPDSWLNQRVYELSAGQKQWLYLISHLDISKNIWLLDEPFENLDQHFAQDLEKIVLHFSQMTKKTVVLIDHDFLMRSSLHKKAKCFTVSQKVVDCADFCEL